MKKSILASLLVLLACVHRSQATSSPSTDAYTYYLKALLQESEGNLASAQLELDKAMAISGDSAYLYKMAAELSFRLGQLDKATTMIEKALVLDRDNAQLFILAGQIYLSQGDADHAEEKLKHALDLDPDQTEALVNLAVAVTPKNPQQAIKLYTDYLDRHPDDGGMVERVAQLYQGVGDKENAKKAWARTLELDPGSLRAHLASAQIAEVEHDTTTAISHYEAVLEQDPTNLPLLLRIGELRYRSDQMAEAYDAFSKAQTIAPTSPSANFWLALLAEQKGDWDEAIRLLKQVALKAPDPGVMLRLSYYYSQVGKRDEAIKILEDLSKTEPENTDFLNYLSIAYEQTKRYSKAIAAVQKLIAIDPDNPEPRFHLATLLDHENKFPEAEAELKRAIKLNPDYHMALNYLGYSYAERDIRLDEAESLINRAIVLRPKSSAYLDSLGWLRYRQKKYETAEASLKESIVLGHDPLIYAHLAEVQEAQKKYAAAVQSYDAALRLAPDQKDFLKKREADIRLLSNQEKILLFIERAGNGARDLTSLKGLARIDVCSTGPCYKNKAQVSYESDKELRIEIPSPLGAPALLVMKSPQESAKFGALHPVFEQLKPQVVLMVNHLEDMLSGRIFTDVAIDDIKNHVSLTAGDLSSFSGDMKFVFDAATGVLKSVNWADPKAGTADQLIIGQRTPNSLLIPQRFTWTDLKSGIKISFDFQHPSVVLTDKNNDDEDTE